ncbi:MAG: hypothetical protein FWG82_07155 [Oscillospiraceae bacterium]|nr:hypothetical protein [Oscillospiraceae bacterium]
MDPHPGFLFFFFFFFSFFGLRAAFLLFALFISGVFLGNCVRIPAFSGGVKKTVDIASDIRYTNGAG